MYWHDDYLDYTSPSSPASPERLRLQAYVDGRLVDSWTEPVSGSRWERFADQFDREQRPAVTQVPEPPRHEQVLRWLDGMVGGRAALLALTGEPADQLVLPQPDPAYAEVHAAFGRVTGEVLDADARGVLNRSLALLWGAAPHAVTGAPSAASVAGGLIWIVGRANGLFDGGFTQQFVRRELWLKQALNVPGQALARHLRGLDFHGERRPRGCPDLASFARPELLTARTRGTLIQWRDVALALGESRVLPLEVES